MLNAMLESKLSNARRQDKTRQLTKTHSRNLESHLSLARAKREPQQRQRRSTTRREANMDELTITDTHGDTIVIRPIDPEGETQPWYVGIDLYETQPNGHTIGASAWLTADTARQLATHLETMARHIDTTNA